MARIVMLADAGCSTGFGIAAHNFGERLVRDYGHELHVLATNHRGDSWPSILDPSRESYMRLYRPTKFDQNDLYGRTRVIDMLKLEPDVVIMFNDPKIILEFLFNNPHDKFPTEQGEQKNLLLRYRPIISYVPCDGINLPPRWTEMLPKVTRMLAMSKWGSKLYSTPEREVEVVYHGVDGETFHPVSPKRPIAIEGTDTVVTTKRECKKLFRFDPDGFLVLRVDTNSGRKDYPASYKALVPFMAAHKDVQVHFHGAATNSQSGVDLAALWSRTPQFKSGERWFVPGLHEGFEGWPISHMVALYNAADVFLSTSRGEGHGMTISESLACGVPVIAQNVSAIPEVVGPGGILIEPARLITVPSGEDTWLADIPAFTAALEQMYANRRVRREMGEAGREHVIKTFNWDRTAEQINHHIEELAAGRFSKPPREPVAVAAAPG